MYAAPSGEALRKGFPPGALLPCLAWSEQWMKSHRLEHRRLVLVGGGHSHLTVLRKLGMRRVDGLQLTLIAKELEAPYSGMLPGLVAGDYAFDECHVDLLRLADFAGARVIHGEVDGIDAVRKAVSVRGRPALGYDVLSIDVGITPNTGAMKGAAEYAIAVKPISAFYPIWTKLLQRSLQPSGPRRIAVIGGGAAGYEIVLAMRRRIVREAQARGIDAGAFSFTLAAGGKLLPALNRRAQHLARREIEHAGVSLVEDDLVTEIASSQLLLASGRKLDCDVAVLCTEGGAAAWLKDTGLPLDEKGFLAVRPTLQSAGDEDVFAAGDCAALIGQPRPKAGVFAVRQGPFLAENLKRRLQDRRLLDYRPQQHFLMLLSNARRRAIAVRGPFAMHGAMAWRWKDWIDRRFMGRFQNLPEMDGKDEEMRCGGCGAKVGPVTLERALARLEFDGARDDAAVIDAGGPALRLESVDFFRAFWPDPYVLGEIAAQHALGDIFAMGGKPERAQLICALPFSAPKLTEEDLFQMVAGARSSLRHADVELIGGHTSEAEEMSIGFAVSGCVSRDRIVRKGGLIAGQRLILTRPLGSGILFAAAMRRKASAPSVLAAIEELRRSQAEASRILLEAGATGATDVTGFGLVGHLHEMVMQSGVAAELDLAAIPLFDTVLDLARQGVASSVLPQNLALAGSLSGSLDAAELAVLCDPQTAGGLLAGIPAANANDCLRALRAAGYRAAMVGRVENAGSGSRIGSKGRLGEGGKAGP